MKHQFPFAISRLTPLLLAGALAVSCATSKPHIVYDAEGQATSFKRFERFSQRDYLHHFVRKVYNPPGSDFKFEGQDQTTIQAQWGNPEYVRKPFRALENEKVEEWVYHDRQHIFQFIKGELVFEGPLTDLEQTFLQYGYPDRIMVQVDETGKTVHALIYRSIFSTDQIETVYIADGKLVHKLMGS